jgi:anti-sigma factor RsiW
MLTCRELVELITDYVEGALDAARHASVVRHLSECDECLRHAAQPQQTGGVLASMPADKVSAADRAALVATYRAWCVRLDRPPPPVPHPSGNDHGSVIISPRPWPIGRG